MSFVLFCHFPNLAHVRSGVLACPTLLVFRWPCLGDLLTWVSDQLLFPGSIDDETKLAFVAEVERVGRDPVYWVRQEASFAVGALAKVVPQEVVLTSLVS